jgi:GntR family transcriptional regulator
LDLDLPQHCRCLQIAAMCIIVLIHIAWQSAVKSAPFLFSISPGAADPIYRQLADQVERMIAGGVLKPGDTLPSVRDVAEALAVNPMTVSKAYSQLQAAGLVERMRGVGIAVAARRAAPASDRVEILRPSLERLAREAKELSLSEAQLVHLLKQAMRDQS